MSKYDEFQFDEEMMNLWNSLPGKIVRSPSIRLEGRGGFDNFKFARVGARVGGDIG